jgi:O-succinylbenzoic acid--CoA ligase
MVANQNSLDWQSGDNAVLLNPRWPAYDIAQLHQVASTLSEQFQLSGHVWLATSGSTSQSVSENKLVALAKSAFLASAAAVNRHLSVAPQDVWLQVLPRFHVGGLGIEVRALLSGSQVVQDFQRWDPVRARDLLENRKITLASMVPTQVFDLVQRKLPSPKSLRAVIVGGGALTASLYQAGRALGWPLLPSYGMTETCSQIATADLNSLQGTVMPLPKKLEHVAWRTSAEGLLEVNGPSLLSLYGQRQPDGRIVGWDPKVDGWFRGEDYIRLHDDEIQFLGRKNDFIKIGGEGSSMGRLREIFERVLLTSAPELSQQVLLVDAPSERLGTEIHLAHLSSAAKGPSSSEFSQQLDKITQMYNRDVLPYERIRMLKEISHVPRSELGKVLWAQLKKEIYGH